MRRLEASLGGRIGPCSKLSSSLFFCIETTSFLSIEVNHEAALFQPRYPFTPLLISPYSLVMLPKVDGKMMGSVIPGDKIEVFDGCRIQCCQDR